jgi:hypothetical protein
MRKIFGWNQFFANVDPPLEVYLQNLIKNS